MERSVRAILRAETGQYTAAMGEAARATEQVGTAAQGAARQTEQSTQQQTTSARSFSQRLVASARENTQAWTQVGGALAVVGGATTGLMAVVAKTGIGYNSLRQTATQGLVAVTGSTEAATEQMRKLDEYGQNSWLMRDSLIRAQQNMTGFGIETGKVIPYMDALAEGVAGVGGSNQDFEELARVMGQVNSSGRITAATFNQFGARGIDAAQMIADAMGISAARVRDDVTSGALDAGDALDALAAGLVMNFEGSSDLVRNTFEGAVADVQAAFRDIAAIAMAPFVDPEGGGLLTSLIGQVADLLFLLRDSLPDGVIQAGGILTGLGGLATAAAAGFLLLAPRVVDTWDALGNLGRVGARAQDILRTMAPTVGRLAGYGGALGVTALAVGAIVSALAQRGVARDAEDLAAAINEMVVAGERLADTRIDVIMSEMAVLDFGAFEIAKIQADDLADAMERVANPSLTDQASRFFGAIVGFIPGVSDSLSYMKDYDDVIDSMGAALTFLAQDDLPAAQRAFENLANALEITTTQGAIELIDQIPGLRAALEEIAEGAGLATDDTTLLNIALGNMPPEALEAARAQGLLGGATGDTTDEIEDQRVAVQDLMQAHADAAGVVLSHREAENRLEEAYEAATEAIKENGETLDVTSEKGRANRRALDDIADATWEVIRLADDNGASQGELQQIMQRSRDRFIETAEAMGESSDEANRLADRLNLIPGNVTASVTVYGIGEALSRLGTLDRTLNSINGRRVTASVAIRQYGQAAVASGGYMGDFLADGGQPRKRYTLGGEVFGPGTPTSDDIPAMLSRKEFVTRAAAVDYYGVGTMYAMNNMSIPREQLSAALGHGYAGGGSAGRAPAPVPMAMRATSTGGPSMAVLAPEDRALLRAVASRPVELKMGRRVLAEATSVAGDYGRARGQG